MEIGGKDFKMFRIFRVQPLILIFRRSPLNTKPSSATTDDRATLSKIIVEIKMHGSDIHLYSIVISRVSVTVRSSLEIPSKSLVKT